MKTCYRHQYTCSIEKCIKVLYSEANTTNFLEKLEEVFPENDQMMVMIIESWTNYIILPSVRLDSTVVKASNPNSGGQTFDSC